jgi:hypothetical protein
MLRTIENPTGNGTLVPQGEGDPMPIWYDLRVTQTMIDSGLGDFTLVTAASLLQNAKVSH